LIALFKKNTFAGSMMMLVNGNRLFATSQFTALLRIDITPFTNAAIG
jgi:hypothetical protein